MVGFNGNKGILSKYSKNYIAIINGVRKYMVNACINIVSSRSKCIKLCIKSLWDHFNYKYDYPVYIYYFDDIYDSLKFRKKIRNDTSDNVHFAPIQYKTPDFIPENELFYNRRDLEYVKKNFSIERKGYLHMCHFICNMYGYENTEIKKYDYIMVHDDESGYTKELPYNPFTVMSERSESMGAYIVGKRLKDGLPHQGHLDTRLGLWEFTKCFLNDNKIIPASESMKKLLIDPNAEWNFHFIDWCDTYVIKTEIFKSEIWKKWIIAVNESGGIYKYRWGDNEIISLFAQIYDKQIYNLKTIEDGFHNQGMFRGIQNIAPNVKNLRI